MGGQGKRVQVAVVTPAVALNNSGATFPLLALEAGLA
jgi:hypothetical protein